MWYFPCQSFVIAFFSSEYLFVRESQVVNLAQVCCQFSSLRPQLESHLNCSHYLYLYFVRKCYQVGVWLSLFEQQCWIQSQICTVDLWRLVKSSAPPSRMFPVCRCQCFSCGWHPDNVGDNPACIVSWWNTGSSSFIVKDYRLSIGLSLSALGFRKRMSLRALLLCDFMAAQSDTNILQKPYFILSETAWKVMSLVFVPTSEEANGTFLNHLHAGFGR